MASTAELVSASINRVPSDGETLVVRNHLTQVLTFMLKSGLRFFPLQDGPLKLREKFINQILAQNKLELYLWGVAELFLGTGSILWYLRPVGKDGYETKWYTGGRTADDRQYKAVFKPGGRELDYVVIRYSYEAETQFPYGNNTMGAPIGPNGSQTRWVRLIINEFQIIEEYFATKPGLDLHKPQQMQAPINRLVTVNSLGFIPCVESPNDPLHPGDSGHGEFDSISNQIEIEDELRASMTDNAFEFNNSTLVTTRSQEQVMDQMRNLDAGIAPRHQQGWAQQQGFYSISNPTATEAVPFVRSAPFSGTRRARRNRRVASVIGNVREDERFGYVSPDPLNADIWRFAQEYREGIHQALGSIDPLSYRYTDWQSLRGLVGQVECTAKRKNLSLFTYGLCEILRMAIYVEEQLFLQSYKMVLSPILKKKPEAITDEEVMQDFYSQEYTRPGVQGLPPYGDRTVRWQWLGPLFEPDSREKQVATINARNLQEAGVGSIHALRELFPGKTDKEIKAMLTGIPLRYANDVANSITMLLQVQQQLMMTPDPANPTMPMGATVSLAPLIQQMITNFYQQVSNEELYDPSDPNSEPISNRNFLNGPANGFSPSSIPILPGSTPDFVSAIPISGTVSGGPIPYANLLPGGGGTAQLRPSPGPWTGTV